MTKYRARTHSISGAFVFLLLGIFAVFALLIALLSARFYRATVVDSEVHSVQRAAANYLMNTLRAADQQGAVSVQDGMLVINWPAEEAEADSDDWEEADPEDEEYEASSYQTRIYCHDGSLRELLYTGESFDPEDGEIICAMESFVPALQDQMLTISYQDGERSRTLHIRLYCGEAAE